MKRRLTWCTFAAGLASAATLAGAAIAQEAPSAYPSRNVTLVVPQAAGGPPDVVARLVSTPLSEILGKPIVIENRPGASASIGAAAVAKAAPDGYTLLCIEITVVVAPSLVAKVAYDPATDFAPDRQRRPLLADHGRQQQDAGSEPEGVHRAGPRQADELKFASSGIGSPPHLGAQAFMQATGIEMSACPLPRHRARRDGYRRRPYRSDLRQPRHRRSPAQGRPGPHPRRYRPAALPSLPDIPTFKEIGHDLGGLDDGVWFGLAAPAGTPGTDHRQAQRRREPRARRSRRSAADRDARTSSPKAASPRCWAS